MRITTTDLPDACSSTDNILCRGIILLGLPLIQNSGNKHQTCTSDSCYQADGPYIQAAELQISAPWHSLIIIIWLLMMAISTVTYNCWHHGQNHDILTILKPIQQTGGP
jgi:hypothetical protein